MMYYGDYNWPFMVFGGGFMIVFWIIIVIGFVYFLKEYNNGRGSDENENKALNILKERYAKGEIDLNQFEEMKKNLK
ncbi:MAG: SHOCT domain-containing protein [Candidatus Gracilibacteria bacterium]|nr:SHOCT domain-containing protein [Candidatus Gracilibacteria bacterium]